MPSTNEYDYDELGFKCGIEIHQQLDTETKLFSRAANETRDMEAVAKVSRKLRPVASEMGEIDLAAKYEFLKDKTFQYNIYPGVTSLIELDEEPPRPANQEALTIALEGAKLMHCTIPDEIHFMRKMVIDGSNTTGFQRTAIIGLDGYIETSEGEVAIEDMELEEESAGIHERRDSTAIFDLDRLGIPLIEIGTDASIQSPSHAKEVAQRIGMLLRSTGKVKRGLGTIRQDVNVSIADGARIEIKGFQDLEMLDELVRLEVERQKNLVELQDEIDADTGEISTDVTDVTEFFEGSENEIIRQILDNDGVVVAFKLRDLEGLMGQNISGDLHLGKELANYAKSQGAKGMMHTDEDTEKYGLDDEFDTVADELDKQDGEVVVIIAEQEENAWNAAEIVADRADKLPGEIPEETRTAEMDQTTRYARPLPGKARMYPETDIPPITMTDEDIQELEDSLPETLEEKEERFEELVGAEFASQVIKSDYTALFERAVDEYDIDPDLAANIVTNILGNLESRGVPVDNLTEDGLETLMQLLADDELQKGQIEDVLREAANDPDRSVEDVASDMETSSEDEIRDVIQNVINQKQNLIEEQGEHARGALMGLVMQELENPDGATVNKVLSEELEKAL